MKLGIVNVALSAALFSCTPPVPQEQIEVYMQETNNMVKLAEQITVKAQQTILLGEEKEKELFKLLSEEKKEELKSDEQLQEKINEKRSKFEEVHLKYLELNDSINTQILINEKFISSLKVNKMSAVAAEKNWKNIEHKIRDYEVSARKMGWQLEDASKEIYMLYQVAQAKYGRTKKQ